MGLFGKNKRKYQEYATYEKIAKEWLEKGLEAKDFKEKIECYDRALEIYPRYVYAWYNKGFVLEYLGRYEGAIECYNRALEIDPTYESPARRRKMAIEHLERRSESIRAALRSIKKEEFSRAAHLYREIGEEEKAKEMERLDKKLRKAKGYEKSLNYERAAELYEELEMWDDARRCRELVKEHSKKKAIKRHINIPEEEEKIDLTGIGDFFSYRIGKKIGQGGFSKVHLVEDEDGDEFAMKIPLDADLKEEETLELPEKILESFIKEARIWNTLTENKIPGIVELYGFGVRPFPWFVMEYMPNGCLRNRIGNNGMDEKEAVEIAIKVLNTLYYIHHYGIVHRDIKPENILFDHNDEPKLTDFGLGKALGKASKSSQGFSGTIEYSAPEQLSKRKYGNVDWRTDIYQVGAMLYEMLSGRPPFESDDLGEVTTAILMEDSEPINEIDERLNKVVLKALEKRKEDRWQGAMEFKKALEVDTHL